MKTRAGLLCAVMCAIAICAAPGFAHASLITNGSFESPVVTPGTCLNLEVGSLAITGWEVTGESIDLCDTAAIQAADGQQSLDLDGFNNHRGGVIQQFPTVSGQDYLVSFQMAGNIGDPVIKTMRVEAAGQFAEFLFDTTGHSLPSMGWEARAWIFTADGPTADLEFFSLDTLDDCGACAAGPALDNVSVTAVPEPSAVILVVVAVLVTGAARRRFPATA